MPEEISKEKIDRLINEYFSSSGSWLKMSEANPGIFNNIKDFLVGGGKRLRPLIFRLSYNGYADEPLEDIYKVELALEFLHSFVVIHDDIIDRSEFRRKTPSLHARFGKYLKNAASPGARIKGEDLAIVAGDIIYALAINIFQSVSAAAKIKEKAMSILTETAFTTGYGEMLEMLEAGIPLEDSSTESIYKIYDLKTAHYTFCCPLILGAVFAGNADDETEKLNEAGLALGRSYQIMDDIHELLDCNDISEIPVDLTDKTHTLLLLRAFETGSQKERGCISSFLRSRENTPDELMEILAITRKQDVIQYGIAQIDQLKQSAWKSFENLKMKEPYKSRLIEFINGLISIKTDR